MKLTFWGAARTVTGSMHEVEANGHRLLLDCGLYQGRRREAFERNRDLPVRAADVDAVLLSHAHIDHSGNLPSLARHGYEGLVHTSPATVDLCGAMLRDSAFLQEKDALFVNKRRRRRRALLGEDGEETTEPLYTTEDAEAILARFRGVDVGQGVEVAPGVRYSTVEAGHMLGSTAMVVEAESGGRTIRLGFSGDVGRKNLPIIRDPQTLPPVDYLILESTYGDRLHEPMDLAKNKLADTVRRTAARGGRIVAPAFAVGRTQQLVLMLHELMLEKEIPNIPIFVDSPLAVNVTEVFRKHTECYDAETREFLNDGKDPFGFSRLRYVREAAESKALNDLRGPMLILSASGMCEAGRVIHHLRNSIEDSRNTVLITGYQAENTLGRKIVERHAEVPIFGEPMRLRAEVVRLNELFRPRRSSRTGGMDGAGGTRVEVCVPGAWRTAAAGGVGPVD